MKNGLIAFLMITILASCRMAMFSQLEGTPQTSFPDTLIGNYYLKVPSGWFKKSDKDTLFVEIRKSEYVLRDSGESLATPLDENHQLLLLSKRYYAIANHDDEHTKFWTYIFLEPSKKGIKCYGMFEDGKANSLPKYFGKQFVQLNNAGDSVFVYQATEAQLTNYYQKVLKKKDALELVRIKK